MNKLFIYKDLYDEFNIDYTWIDLDTYIYYDISYINNVSNIFLEIGGTSTRLEKVTNDYYLEYNKNIQGNFWKLNNDLYNKLNNLLSEIINSNKILLYDTCSLCSLLFYKVLNGDLNKNNINIIGNNFKESTINGLSIWCERDKAAHANIDGLEKLYIEDNLLKSRYHNGKEIHIVSFTFDTLNLIKNNGYFKKIF